jgi:hypothetical protein
MQPSNWPPPPPVSATRKDTFGSGGAFFAGVGAVMVLIAFTSLNWLSASGEGITFSDIHRLVSLQGAAANAPAQGYFGGLGWVFLVAVTASASYAVVPAAPPFMRAVSFLLGVAAVIVTFVAIAIGKDGGGGVPYGTYIKHAEAGFWVAVAGFALIGLGGSAGSRRSATAADQMSTGVTPWQPSPQSPPGERLPQPSRAAQQFTPPPAPAVHDTQPGYPHPPDRSVS